VAGAPAGNPHAVPFVAYDSEVTRIGTDENWQSEFLQVLAFVTLTSFLIFKGSPESRDSDGEIQAKLDRIEQRLDEFALFRSPTFGRSTACRASDCLAGYIEIRLTKRPVAGGSLPYRPTLELRKTRRFRASDVHTPLPDGLRLPRSVPNADVRVPVEAGTIRWPASRSTILIRRVAARRGRSGCFGNECGHSSGPTIASRSA